MTPNRSFMAFQNYYFSCTRRISLLIDIGYTEKRSHIFKNNSIFRKKSVADYEIFYKFEGQKIFFKTY